jgi:hypothetical protein
MGLYPLWRVISEVGELMGVFDNIIGIASTAIKNKIDYLKDKNIEGLLEDINATYKDMRLTGAVGSILRQSIPNIFHYMKSIPTSAFFLNEDLTSAVLPANVTSIGSSGFNYCIKLEKVEFKSSNIVIGAFAFKSCGSLKEIVGNSITIDGVNCFESCESLISFPEITNTKTLPAKSFFGCRGLTKVAITDGIEIINDKCFAQCENLNELHIPKSVQLLQPYCFDYCHNLTTIYYAGTKNQWKQIKKHGTWRSGCGEQKVICSDGELTLRSRV